MFSPMERSQNFHVVPDPVTIAYGDRLVMPRVCVACGATCEVAKEYTQDHLPITLPGIAFLTSTNLTLPYCALHERRFRRRFFWLRLSQAVGYVLAISLGMVVLYPQVRPTLGFPVDASVVEYVLAGGAFAYLVLSIFVIKPFLYDVFVVVGNGTITFRGGAPLFRERLIAANAPRR
jgi:hypothetical protein